jgi:hypothetical protein
MVLLDPVGISLMLLIASCIIACRNVIPDTMAHLLVTLASKTIRVAILGTYRRQMKVTQAVSGAVSVRPTAAAVAETVPVHLMALTSSIVLQPLKSWKLFV